ncbi:AMP deaminase [Platanthera guangdongensis]|uniref:AMP deaminase n=1 Tax=Platanthera guangdongensis TaxID=2320717 RepID=A0ABR2LFM0_9ASPA
MDQYPLHLAMAALVGASFVAVSAFYMHRKTLSQLLEFARAVEMERDRDRVWPTGAGGVAEDGTGERDGDGNKRLVQQRSHGQHRRKGPEYHTRSGGSMSLSDVKSAPEIDGEKEYVEAEGRLNGLFSGVSLEDHRNLSVPPGLPRLQTVPEGKKQSSSINKNIRAGHALRPPSPRSPSASAFESMEASDGEDDLLIDDKLDSSYLHVNGDLGSEHTKLFQAIPDCNNANGEVTSMPCASIIRSHSVSGDLHGVQPDPVAADILRKEPEQETFIRLKITPHETPSMDEIEVYKILQECLEKRNNYLYREEVAPWEKEIITDPSTPKPNPNPFAYAAEQKSDHVFEMVDGVVHVYPNKDYKENLYPVADATSFFTDLHHILRVISAGNIRTLCHHRLNLLEQKFNLHLMLNADREFLAQKTAPHRDFYNVRKVDTHVHHSACMNQKHLLRFIKSKLRKEPDEVVIFRDGTYLTLREVFESLDLTGYDLNVDLLDVHADKSTFHRFDKFNLKYNPCGQSRLREIFLKQDNLIQGRFLAELTKQVFSDLDASKYQMAEYRVSIYGRKQSEWDQLASWIVNNELYSENVVWLIQLPRLYNVYKEMGIVTSFQNLLDNIFLPLFEVTVDPDSHPQLHTFLKQVVGLDLVDDESKPERRPTKHMPTPSQWTNIFNPAFSYYAYYCYANLYTLNKLRELKGMTTIKFRPHSGEAGDIDHLAATFLMAHNIAHGINLRKSPVLQYLYYLAQIGLAMSPLSNNSLFLDYHRNPFPMFFQRGLNVSLSTDDPLQIHLTKEPLVEEYSIAASVWKLTSCDLCEIARNSVYQSGFSHALKSHWIGKSYYRRGPDGNDIHKTNVPHIRVEFREMIWMEEMRQVYLGTPKLSEAIPK